ncbi:MAG: 7-carboxy-7-deazaguanine synthase QueE, partial [Candidatus Omnitrophica bacterium]|nr:7-carboxy-7-deazaguanine synthase QueE [Candidatus Omnitrophota bacterium]
MNNTANVLEIFSSIQGEGIYVGERQIFIRFAGCNLNCVYCDTKNNKKPFNLSASQILAQVKKLNKEKIHKT